MFCSVHPTKELDIFCSTDGHAICSRCQFGAHKGHDIDLLSNALHQQKSDLRSLVNDIQIDLKGVQGLSEELSSLVLSIEGHDDDDTLDSNDVTSSHAPFTTSVSFLHSTAKIQVNEVFDALEKQVVEKLCQRRNSLLNELDKLTHAKLEKLHQQLDQVNDCLFDIPTVVQHVEEALAACPPCTMSTPCESCNAESTDNVALCSQLRSLKDEISKLAKLARNTYIDTTTAGDVLTKPSCDAAVDLVFGDVSVQSNVLSTSNTEISILNEFKQPMLSTVAEEFFDTFGSIPLSPAVQFERGCLATNGEEAVRLYRLAADHGFAKAQVNLGNCYRFGEGVEQDAEEAVRWFQLAANQGHSSAQWNLGSCYDCGFGVAKDSFHAVRLYRLAAEQGNVDAQYTLGVCYGNGLEKNCSEAAQWYQLAADQGLVSAQCSLGVCFRNGDGVEKSAEKAIQWFRLAADQGDANGQYNLGLCYKHGDGVQKDEVESVRWYQLAADQGYVRAQYNLGFCYKNGSGVDLSAEEAVRWFRLAAEQGYEDAQVQLDRIRLMRPE